LAGEISGTNCQLPDTVMAAVWGWADPRLAACLDLNPRFMGHYKNTVEIIVEDWINSGKYNKINN